jgi:hypothetical protein
VNYQDLAPYLTPLALATFAIGLARGLRFVALKAHAHALTTKDKGDDAVTQKWLTRAVWLNVATDAVVRYLVPSAFAPEPSTTPGLERAEQDERDYGGGR